MADITGTVTVYLQETGRDDLSSNPFQYKEIIVETPATADTDDTFDLTLANYGITTFKSIKGWAHSTANSVLILEAPTTSVSTGVLTVTIGGTAASNLRRTYLIGGI